MPIYEYRCNDCGFQKEHLQKLNSEPLTTCPSCGSEAYVKLLSAAGFQLKGSGWYATDFKNAGSKPGGSGQATASTSQDGGGETAAPVGCGGGCACHPA